MPFLNPSVSQVLDDTISSFKSHHHLHLYLYLILPGDLLPWALAPEPVWVLLIYCLMTFLGSRFCCMGLMTFSFLVYQLVLQDNCQRKAGELPESLSVLSLPSLLISWEIILSLDSFSFRKVLLCS